MMNNQIMLYDYYAVIVSDSLNTERHAHIAHQITYSLDARPFRIDINDHVESTSAIFIPSQVNHKFLDEKGKFLSILIDNESIFNGEEISVKLRSVEKIPKEAEEIETLLKKLGLMNASQDSRIVETLGLINKAENLEDIRLVDISQNVGLSESRLLHLFKSEVGVPFRKYILWKKLRKAISEFSTIDGRSLTDIALASGFSDSAHLSKVVKASFGLSPSEILKNSQFIKDSSKSSELL